MSDRRATLVSLGVGVVALGLVLAIALQVFLLNPAVERNRNDLRRTQASLSSVQHALARVRRAAERHGNAVRHVNASPSTPSVPRTSDEPVSRETLPAPFKPPKPPSATQLPRRATEPRRALPHTSEGLSTARIVVTSPTEGEELP